MPADAIRILGIDPGSRVTGYGVIDFYRNQSKHVASGTIRIKEGDLSQRLNKIFAGVREVVDQFSPHEMAAEKVFMSKNPDSALKLGQARGAAILAATQDGVPFNEYSPNQIKQAITVIS